MYPARTHWITRLLSGLTSTLTMFALSHLYAAAVSAAPLLQFEDKLGELTEKVASIGRPVTVLSVTLILLSFIFAPVFKRWAGENQEVIMKVLFSAMLLGAVPDIVSFFMD